MAIVYCGSRVRMYRQSKFDQTTCSLVHTYRSCRTSRGTRQHQGSAWQRPALTPLRAARACVSKQQGPSATGGVLDLYVCAIRVSSVILGRKRAPRRDSRLAAPPQQGIDRQQGADLSRDNTCQTRANQEPLPLTVSGSPIGLTSFHGPYQSHD